MRKLFRPFFMLAIICYFIIFSKETAIADTSMKNKNDFMQPTQPCTSITCPESSSDPSSKANLMFLAKSTRATSTKMENIDWEEILKCQEASGKYYPNPEENIFKKEFKKLYLNSCFKKLDRLPEKTAKTIRSHVVRLKKSGEKVGFCNAGLIDDHTLLTARHCLASQKKWNGKIDDSLLAEIEVTGIRENGEDWSIHGLQILEDPIKLKPSSPSSNQLKDLDYIILKPANLQKFPIDSNVTLVRDSGRRPVFSTKRLIFASYLEGKKELLTDYLISCNVFIVNKGYFNHNCQSHARSSGAPVWVFSEDHIPKEIVGVHVGRAGTVDILTSENSGTNEAITLPPPE